MARTTYYRKSLEMPRSFSTRWLVILLAVLSGRAKGGRRELRFSADGRFRVVQFADLHYGEAENLDWGPAQAWHATRPRLRQPLFFMRPGHCVGSCWSQLSDPHRGCTQDANSTRAMDAIVLCEDPTDLVVFSGDQITANNIDENATACAL